MTNYRPPWERDSVVMTSRDLKRYDKAKAKHGGVSMVIFRIPADANTHGKPGIKVMGLRFTPGQEVRTTNQRQILEFVRCGAEVIRGNPTVAVKSVKAYRRDGKSEEDATAQNAHDKCYADGGTVGQCNEAVLDARKEFRIEKTQRAKRIKELAGLAIPTVEESMAEGRSRPDAYASIAYGTALKAGHTEEEASKVAQDTFTLHAAKEPKVETTLPRRIPSVEELVESGYERGKAIDTVTRIKALADGSTESEAAEAGGLAKAAYNDERARKMMAAADAEPPEPVANLADVTEPAPDPTVEVTSGNARKSDSRKGKAKPSAKRQQSRRRATSKP